MLWVFLLVASCNLSQTVSPGLVPEAAPGLVVTALSEDGLRVAGASVEVWPANLWPTPNGSGPTVCGKTDDQGRWRTALEPGTWSIVVRKGGLAFQKFSGSTDSLLDTLHLETNLMGIAPGPGQILSIAGAGVATVSGPGGIFHLDHLPSGDLRLGMFTTTALAKTLVALPPGMHAMVRIPRDSLPSRLDPLLVDSLVAGVGQNLPITLPRQALGDQGGFMITVRFQRQDSAKNVSVVNWTDGAKLGLRVDWHGADTLVIQVNGKTLIGMGIPLPMGSQQFGLSFDGTEVKFYLGQENLGRITSSPTGDRSRWNPPLFAQTGISQVEWIALKRGEVVDGWFEQLAQW